MERTKKLFFPTAAGLSLCTATAKGHSVGGKVINVSISTGDVVLPNAKDGQSFADDLFDFSEKKTGTLHAFDSGTK